MSECSARIEKDAFVALLGGGSFVALEAITGARPICLYAGVDLPGASAEEIALLSTRQHAPGGPAAPLHGSLMNEIGTGISGPSGLIAHGNGRRWAIDLRLVRVEFEETHTITLFCEDAVNAVASQHRVAIDPDTGLVTFNTAIENRSPETLTLDWCAALCLPFDANLRTVMSFTGRWSGEFQIEECDTIRGSLVRENTAGRTSHDVFPGFMVKTAQTSETSGLAVGFHLAWSGNSRWRVDQHNDGRCYAQLGELFFPGEVRLEQGETYQSPDCHAAWSDDGLNGVSHQFHQNLRRSILDKRALAKPRPVHYNTWEAVYFDHDENVLLDLAERAAKVGAERYVLDDGWFGSRRNDAAGLGDWWVSSDVYPNGLHAIVDKVRALGMEFGLWFEPEMVNPDSDLYRAHPEWVLQAQGAAPIASRNQRPLDLTRSEVSSYLFDKMSALIDEYAIDYIKWDMNRDIQHPGGAEGTVVSGKQTRAVYALIERLRAAYPNLEIESCASGGGRADFGILRHTDRIWTSDNNDARQRQHIQRGASHFFPLSVMGSHVGPARCHITGRRFDMHYRVASAIFGHMGMEMDLRDESEADLATLSAGIALHKKHRGLIHEGRFIRLNSSDHTNLVGCVDAAQSEALFSYATLNEPPHTEPAPIRFAGLDPHRQYRTRIVWPLANPSISNPSIVDAASLYGQGQTFSGAALMGHGIRPPLTFPDVAVIYHLEAAD